MTGSWRVDGRAVIVTGAARGLGRAEAIALAARGARVLAVDVVEPSATVAALGGEGAGLAVDLADPGGPALAFGRALELFGDVDAVVNNAGVVRDAMAFNMRREDFEHVLAVNLTATFGMCREAAVLWRGRRDDGTSRAIVNTTSESGLYGNAGQANYAAAKAGVAALTLTLAAELERYGARVNAIAPRARTPMSEGAFGSLGDPYAPEPVGDLVAWLVSDAARGVTGQVLMASGREIQVLRPWSVERRAYRHEPWSDDRLDEELRLLLPPADRRRVPRPIRELFGVRS